MDAVSIQRINTLHPKIRQKVLDAFTHINKKLLGKGVRMRVTHGRRTFSEQNEMHEQGRTKPGTIVTYARGGYSYHNYGLAFDFVILLDKNGDGKFEKAEWSTTSDNDKDGIADWKEVAVYMKSLGFTWGGDWKGKKNDPPHFEMTFGYSEDKLLQKYNDEDFITDNGVKYVNI